MREVSLRALKAVSSDTTAIDLSILRDGRSDPPPLPVDMFGSWAPCIMDVARAANAPEDYVAACLLAAAASCIGNARNVGAWEGWTEPCVLWVAAVGGPSSGKSPAADAITTPLRVLEREALEAFKDTRRAYEEQKEFAAAAAKSWTEELQSAVKRGEAPPAKPECAILPEEPVAPRLLMQDSTSEALASVLAGNPRGLLVCRDELAGWFGSMGQYSKSSADRPFWLEAYGGRSFSVDRKGGKSFTIPHLTVSIFGGIQPEKFHAVVSDSEDDGLSSRFLWLWPRARPFERPTCRPDHQRIEASLRRLRELPMLDTEQGKVPVTVSLSDGATSLLEEWCRESNPDTLFGGPLLKSWMGKGRGHILRLALVLEHLEWAWYGDGPPPETVSETSFQRAAGLYDGYLVPMAERTFGDASLPQCEQDAAIIARYIRMSRKTSIHVRDDIYKKRLGGIAKSERAQNAIVALQDAGWIAREPEPSPRPSGKSKQVYAVNPALWEALKEVS